MAPTGGSENLALTRTFPLEERLFAEPYSFEFFQAVRLLDSFERLREDTASHHQRETVRFAVNPSLGFPASEIQELQRREEGPPLMRVNFMGLIGPQGLLPIYYTELVIDRVRARDHALLDFLDIFHHRIIHLFYRSWRKHHFQVGFEAREEDKFSHYLLDLIGLGTEKLQNRQQIADLSLLCYAGLFAQQPRNATALELILLNYFGVPARVEQFLGAWYKLDEQAQCNLDDTMFDSQQLGFGAVVGDEIWDPQARVRIVLGPLGLEQYLDFLPSGSAFNPLRTLVRFYAGDEFDFEAQLILRREEVPPCELGAEGAASPQLGWLSWSKTKELGADASQAILQLSQ